MVKKLELSKKTKVIVAALLVVILVAGFMVTYALLQAKTGMLENSFTVGEITTKIEEPPVVIGSSISKAPKVKNLGPEDAIIRARVTVSPKEIADSAGININEEKWTKRGDFYYYQGVVAKDGSTEPIFTTVKGITEADGKIKDEFKDVVSEFDITIYQEAVQASASLADDKWVEALDADGSFNWDNAKMIWDYYDSQTESERNLTK